MNRYGSRLNVEQSEERNRETELNSINNYRAFTPSKQEEPSSLHDFNKTSSKLIIPTSQINDKTREFRGTYSRT